MIGIQTGVMPQTWKLFTLKAEVNQQLAILPDQCRVTLVGQINPAGPWIIVSRIVRNPMSKDQEQACKKAMKICSQANPDQDFDRYP